jgi:perosamine synthetase
MMKVPQFSPWVGKEEIEEIAKCIDSNWITEGPISKEFSEKLLALIGSRFGVFAPNGTLALYLALRVAGIKAGDEVLIPDFTFIASATSVEMVGARPIFVDVNRKNFQIDLTNASRLVTKRTKAIMPVHIYGTIANMDKVMDFAKKYNLKVVEDAAQAIDVRWRGKHAGTFGEVGCFSFFADKTITTGEGGFIVTDNEAIYNKLLFMRNQGRINRGSFIHPEVGYNFRMTDLQNAMGLAQLTKLVEIKKRKAHILGLYRQNLKEVEGITFFEPEKGAEWIPFRVGILCDSAHELMAYMQSRGVEPRTFFYPLHRQPCFSCLKDKTYKNDDSEFPNAVYAYEHGVCLPTFPTLSDEQVKYVCQTIKQFQGKDLFYEYYDVFYKDKDYSKETDIVLELSKKYGLGLPNKVLEIGCGTGNHTKNLASKTKNLIAIDTDKKMVSAASEKMKKLGIKNVKIINESIENLAQDDFDLAIALFNVVTYIPDTKSLNNFMKAVAKNLKPGGIFVFDCWNGAAAIIDPPKVKKLLIKLGAKKISYTLTPETDSYNQKTIMNYEIVVSSGKSKQVGGYSFNQTLWMPREIKSSLVAAGLEIIFISPSFEIEREVSEKDWKIMFCVRKPK